MTGAMRADWVGGERRLGKYQLIRRLATGGMAEIYLARAAAIEGFEKTVVLKRILPQHAENESFIRMFLAEARLAANLHHPNIVQVYDIGQSDGAYFFAMEYVQGVDLRQLLNAARRAERELPLQHILHIIIGVCAGLHYAHEKKDPSGVPLGIVHRDISPSNVLVTFDGGVKVVDFGIAKAANVSTTAGSLKGKIPYMSPEQCRSRPLDRRSDVFSIGTLLWELSTGRRLFRADNELALLAVVADGTVTPPREVRPDYPPALEAIVLKALAADVDERWPNAQALQLALEDFAHEAGLPLSAARLQPFVQEVCADRIAKVEAMLASDHGRGSGSGSEMGAEMGAEDEAPDEETSVFDSGGLPSGTPGPTPSPAGATAPGAERVVALGTAVPVTEVNTSAPVPTETPRDRRRFGMVLGMGAAFVGVGVAAWMMQDPSSEPAPAPSPASVSDTPNPEPPAPVPAEVATPDDPATPSVPVEPAGGEPTDAEPSPAEPPSIDPPSESPSVEEPAESPPRARKRKSSAARRSTSRPSSGKSNSSAAPKEREPKWDPKAAPPPGL